MNNQFQLEQVIYLKRSKYILVRCFTEKIGDKRLVYRIWSKYLCLYEETRAKCKSDERCNGSS